MTEHTDCDWFIAPIHQSRSGEKFGHELARYGIVVNLGLSKLKFDNYARLFNAKLIGARNTTNFDMDKTNYNS